ncbi:hypothetical protein [Sphingomonas abietis]|uniref:Galactosyl transferase GMA12/MNN10 family protein n=1 Tax=Sphingomonas abietis TaxID=3012344 RepID=A0ABY7NIP0_9SPHN|nr:hypothetical protein [Sphingomonas abietis]WBO21384.1 hypothetical protein PBT88_14470 [Sphingomonas abietis]
MNPGDVALVTFNAVPRHQESLKYARLGAIGVAATRAFAARHGHHFYGTMPDVGDRPACWAKIPALRAALRHHRWAIWVDADAVALHPASVLPLLDTDADLVCERPDSFFRWLGLDPALGRAAQPVQSAVFALRASPWTMQLLDAAWDRTEFITPPTRWNGIGEQEAINAVLKRRPAADRDRMQYVQGLQAPPALAAADTRFVHFYGDRAHPILPATVCAAVLDRFADAVEAGDGHAMPLALVHWSAIQRVTAGAEAGADARRSPACFGYDRAMLVRAAAPWMRRAG